MTVHLASVILAIAIAQKKCTCFFIISQMPKKAAAASAPEASASAPAAPAVKTYTMDEIKKHNTRKDCWIVVCASLRAFVVAVGRPGHS